MGGDTDAWASMIREETCYCGELHDRGGDTPCAACVTLDAALAGAEARGARREREKWMADPGAQG